VLVGLGGEGVGEELVGRQPQRAVKSRCAASTITGAPQA
jgi:predicted N-acetyltransferase YhbS